MIRPAYSWLLLLLGCTRPPAPVPIQVSTAVPARLQPVPFSVSGQVLLADTRRPVAGVQVRAGRYYARYTGSVQEMQLAGAGGQFTVVTDAQGRFSYAGAVAPNDTSRFLLFVNGLQYSGRAWCPIGPAQQVTILLRPTPRIQLPPDSCHANVEGQLLNPYATRWDIHTPFTGWYIDNARSPTATLLRSVSLRGSPVEGLVVPWPLYFQLFAVNPATGGPGETIFTQEAYVQFPKSGQVATYDLTPYQISVPPGGFYVVMAPVLSGNAARILQEQEHYRPSGRLLRAPCAFAESRSWMYEQGRWQPLPRARNTWPLFERLITLEVGPADAPGR